MSDIMIALLLIVPIIVVVIILNVAAKKRKKQLQKRINAYIAEAAGKSGFQNYYRKQLTHQTVIIDEKLAKLMIVEHNGIYSYDVYPLDLIKNVLVINETQTLEPQAKGEKKEILTTKIGVGLSFTKYEDDKYLVLYDYLQHNIYTMKDFEKDAHQLRDVIEKASNGNKQN